MSSSLDQQIRKHLRFNVTVNLLDGAFFGFALGFSSFSAFIPIFVSRMTDSAILFGLVPAMHSVGWQFPQLFTAGWVSRLRRYKPFVILMTTQERIPFFGLAVVAWFLPELGKQNALILTFLLLAWQGLGGGFTANAWTSMISKVIPTDIRGTFFGVQAAAANALLSLGSVLAGILLAKVSDRHDFSLLFLLAGTMMTISWGFLALTREPVDHEKEIPAKAAPFWKGTRTILRRDVNFRWFLATRLLAQVATMGFAFYIIYGVKRFDMDEITAGILYATLTIAQIVVNPLMGWAGDRWGHRRIMVIGALATALSGVLAWWAPALGWFYPVMLLTALASVAIWTLGLAMTVEFGTEVERPVYIGMANTLVAPVAILAPLFGGWLADVAGYRATFMTSAVGGIFMAIVLYFLVKDPKRAAGYTIEG